MKKYMIPALAVLIAMGSCTDLKKSMHDDIEDMNSRLDAVEAVLGDLNRSIDDLYRITAGTVLVTGYVKDEKGNAVLSLSDGTSMTIYSGIPEQDIPSVAINEDGYWTYTLYGETSVVTDASGNPVSALPQDGKDGHVPYISIDGDGYWCYTIGEETFRVGNKYGYADISKIPASIFGNVAMDGNVLVITSLDGSKTRIPLLGGLDMTFSLATVTLQSGADVSLTATLTAVSDVILDKTPLQVVLTDEAENNLTIGAEGVAAGNYKLHFSIFSAEGYRLVKSLHVVVE